MGVVIDHTNTFVNLSLFTILCLALWAIIASTTILLAYKLSRWIWVTFVVNAIKQKHEKDKTDYLVKVNQILVSKNYYGHDACPALYELIDFLFEERYRTLRKIPWFKWSGFFLLLGIPIVSTLLSVLIGTGPNTVMSTFIEPLSVGLTLATVISATIKPAEHFRRLCKLGVHIDKSRSELLLDLEGLQHLPVPMLEPKREKHHGHCRGSVDENEVEINRRLRVLIHAKRRALMNISLALIDDFLPEGKTPDQDTQNKSVGEKIDPTLTWKHVR